LPDFLDAIARSISEAIVVEQLHELVDGRIEVYAWALSDGAAQDFGRKLVANFRPGDFKLEDFKVQLSNGRLGLAGYRVQFKLVPEFKENME
jgi:hypothetical protein